MRIHSKVSIICIFTLIIASSLLAHDTWLVPSAFHCAPGDTISVDIATGMEFPASESPVLETRVHTFKAIHGSMSLDPNGYSEANEALRAEFRLPDGENSTGTWTAVCSLNARLIELGADDFNDYLLHDGLTRVHEYRKQNGLLEDDAIERYTKHTKTLIQVGDNMDNNPTQPFGQTIEILPTLNPYSLKQGDSLTVKVLFREKPLAGAEIAWTYNGKGGFAGSAVCDENGVAEVPLAKAGIILIRTIHMEHVKQPDYEWESNWASLTFEVK